MVYPNLQRGFGSECCLHRFRRAISETLKTFSRSPPRCSASHEEIEWSSCLQQLYEKKSETLRCMDAERYCTVTKLTIRVLGAWRDFLVKSPLDFFQCYHLLLNPPWTHDSVCENNFLIGMKWENLCVWSLLLEEVCNENWRVPRILIFPTWAKQN